MVFLCFVLDLRSLPLPLLRDLKQSLLQLANYYAISYPKINSSGDTTQSNSKPLFDRIGLCYVFRNRISCSDELKIAYNPHGNFNLRDLHHALNNLPMDAFSPESNDFGAVCKELKLADVLSDKVVYACGGHDKNVARKVILISSCLVDSLDSVNMKALMDAGDKRVSVEFIFVEQTSSHLSDITENINHFGKQIASLENCSFQTCVPDLQVLLGLAKRWFQELKDDVEEPLQARFVFKINLISTLNQMSCNLHTSFNPICDEFISCQDHESQCVLRSFVFRMHSSSSCTCPVTNDDLGALDIIENSVKVGEQTLLHMPSFHDSQKLQKVPSPIDFHAIQRTNLGSLSEGLIMGATYFVTPSTFSDSDENGQSEINIKLFQVVCSVLNSLDQGLICSSNCNIETKMETSFRNYLQLAASEEVEFLLNMLLKILERLEIPRQLNRKASEEAHKETKKRVGVGLGKSLLAVWVVFPFAS
ncbi:hypothetical protein BUALT_Bualt02G0098900 [Buddleja alternifolia]|uniref:Uncharacterized protein n=1 Tax=Buddleja alternifolia TaxID=168488 RepID=A0AAV6Y0C2_9LAMI|nr:hypothetical protein BUALT_Bualt02G0098900 [Buddleja alternifolia]